MSHESPHAKLVYMANQIGKFFMSQGGDAAVKGTAEHIRKFWDPRMRNAIFAHLDAGGDGLDAPVRRAIEELKGAEPKAGALKAEAAKTEAAKTS